jgi:hypothetical protein
VLTLTSSPSLRRQEASLGASARAAVLPYLVGRALTIGALLLARFLASTLHVTRAAGAKAIGTAGAGLVSWDAAWYRRIAEVGYGGTRPSAVRFFPLYPLFGHALSLLPGVSAGAALLVITNVSGFAALVLLHQLVSREQLPEGSADRSLWVLSLWPAAFVLTMGYAEALFLVCSIAAFLAWRGDHWWWGVLPAYLAGATRPVGILLAVPAFVECVRWWRSGSRRSGSELGARACSILAGPAGAATYLAWTASTGRGFLAPLTEQLSGRRRGGLSDPFVTLARDASDFLHGHHLGTALHAPFVLAFAALAVYLLLRLPAAYGWYAVATVLVGITAHNLDSFERYGLACFPLAVGAACWLRRPAATVTLLCASAAAMTVLALLAFLGLYVP